MTTTETTEEYLILERDEVDENIRLPEGVHNVAVFHMKESIGRDGRWMLAEEKPALFDLRETHEPVAIFRGIEARTVFHLTQNIESSWVEDARAAGHEVFTEEEGMKSTSVGDLVVIDGEAYLCEAFGWTAYHPYHVCPGPACCIQWD